MLIFNKGDKVVHPVHGAGIVTGRQTFVVEGSETHYLCIELSDAANSKVMTPIESMTERGLREAIGSFELVREVMFKNPRELDDNHRTRQANIRARIDEGGLRHVIQGLRDLYWREHTQHLTNTDKRLRSKLMRRVHQELIVKYKMSKERVKVRINKIIEAAIEKHAATAMA